LDRMQEYGLELILDTMLKMYEDKGGKLPISKEQLLRFLKFFVSVDMDQQRQVLEGKPVQSIDSSKTRLSTSNRVCIMTVLMTTLT